MYQLAIKQYLDRHGFEALNPKAVLFDMDGVLYDSMPNHAIAWQQSMAQFGIKMTADDAYATEGARGVDTIRKMVMRQQGREIDEAEAQKMYDVKSQIFHELPEAPVMLINRILKDFGTFVDEAHITTAYDVRRGKPKPDPYLKGLRKAGDLQPYEAFVVENAPLGIRAGAAAKIFTIAVNTGPLPAQTLLDANADLLFPTMTDFCENWGKIMLSL